MIDIILYQAGLLQTKYTISILKTYKCLFIIILVILDKPDKIFHPYSEMI